MPDERAPAPALEFPRLEEVEAQLDLADADRDELPGLYRLNVVRIPRVRLVGFTLCLAVLALHNRVVLGSLDAPRYVPVAVGVLAYCLLSWGVLFAFFARVRAFHLGTLFVWLDLLAMTAVVYAGGGERSLMWPVYFVRVADQMWISQRRTVALAIGGVMCYALLIVALGTIGGHPIVWPLEAVKVVALLAMSAALAAVVGEPVDIWVKTIQVRDLFLRLEHQSNELERERVRAEVANRAKSDFLARMSHELRTPLNSVVGFANVLLRKAEGREHEYLTRIRENGLHLLELVNDILDLARIEEGRMELHLTDVDVGALAEETLRQLEGRTLGGPVALVLRAPHGPCSVRADEARLKQVLINLVGNALKFTERGSVDVEVLAEPDGRSARAVHVRDSGIGISPERLPYIFHPFEQADGTTSRKYGGAGLGLAISRSLCEMMGFELGVVSTPGRGSTFTIDLRPGTPLPAPTPELAPTSPVARPG